MLTVREYQIIHKLLDSQEELTIKALSNELNVSVRTIKYDLENVRDWLKKHEIELHSRPNKGIWITETEEVRRQVKATIFTDRSSVFYTQEDRVKKMIQMLILSPDCLTAQQLGDSLLVSRNTIISDLNKLEEYITPWQVTLKREPRIGFDLVGKELYKRILLEHILQSNLDSVYPS